MHLLCSLPLIDRPRAQFRAPQVAKKKEARHLLTSGDGKVSLTRTSTALFEFFVLFSFLFPFLRSVRECLTRVVTAAFPNFQLSVLSVCACAFLARQASFFF